MGDGKIIKRIVAGSLRDLRQVGDGKCCLVDRVNERRGMTN